ncbi:MAG: recombinase family protein [Phycisphaeraceae bacterium]
MQKPTASRSPLGVDSVSLGKAGKYEDSQEVKNSDALGSVGADSSVFDRFEANVKQTNPSSAEPSFQPIRDETYAYFNPRGGRVASPSKGLPAPGDVRKLAAVWLTQQQRHWPELVRAGVIPGGKDQSLDELCREFEQTFLTKQLVTFTHGLKSAPWEALGVGYTRYSSAMQNPRSLDDQLHQILDRAARERIYIPWSYIFADASVTGTVATRTGYQLAKQVLHFNADESVSTLFVDEIDRASRDGLQILSLGNLITEHGKRLIGVTSGFDSNNEQSRMMLYMYAMFNDQFMTQHRAKVMRGRRGALRRKMVIRPLPFGLIHAPMFDASGQPIMNKRGGQAKTAIADPETRWVLELLAHLCVDRQYSLRQICREFNTRQIGGRDNWSAPTLHGMLSNHRYVGIFIEGMKRNLKDPATGKQRFVPQPRSEWSVIRIKEAQIWSWKRWKQIQQRLKETSNLRFGKGKAAQNHRVQAYPTTVFTNILYCGHCGRPLRLRRGGKTYSMFCRNGLDKRPSCELRSSKSSSVFEPALLNFVKSKIFTTENLERLVVEANRYIAAEAERPRLDVEPLRATLDQIRRKRDRLVDALAESLDPNLDAIRDRIGKLETEMKELTSRIRAAEQEDQDQLTPLCRDKVIAMLDDLRSVLYGDVAVANSALQKLLGAVPITQKVVPGAKRPIWIAKLDGDLVPLVADFADRHDLPDASNLMKLMLRSWKMPVAGELTLYCSTRRYELIATEVAELAEKGLSNAQIAAKLDVHVYAVRQARAYRRTGRRPGEVGPPPAQYKKFAPIVQGMVNDGMSVPDVARKLGINYHMARAALRYATEQPADSEPVEQEPPAYKQYADEAHRLYLAGMSNGEIAKRLNISQAIVTRAARFGRTRSLV